MSISLTESEEHKSIYLHSLDEDFMSTNPTAHVKPGKNGVMIYLILPGEKFGLDVPLLRDVALAYQEDDEPIPKYYEYLQHQFRAGDLQCLGWVYADEVDINKGFKLLKGI